MYVCHGYADCLAIGESTSYFAQEYTLTMGIYILIRLLEALPVKTSR